MFNYTNIDSLAAAAGVFLNYTKDQPCLNLTADGSQGLDDSGWTVQTCYDMVLPMGDDPTNEIFSWVNWDQEAHTKFCQDTFGLTPKYDWALDYWGGRDIARDFASASKIIFSNGKLDPWSVGGINQNKTADTIVLTIKNSPHHLDLRLPNP